MLQRKFTDMWRDGVSGEVLNHRHHCGTSEGRQTNKKQAAIQGPVCQEKGKESKLKLLVEDSSAQTKYPGAGTVCVGGSWS